MRRMLTLVVAGCALLAAGSAGAEPKDGAKNAVSGVAVDQQEDGTHLRVESESTPSFSVFKLKNPLRLVVDISNSRLGAESRTRRLDNGVISRVALLETEKEGSARVRLIVGFEQAAHYDVRTEEGDVVIFVEGGSGESEGRADQSNQDEQVDEARAAAEETKKRKEQLKKARQKLTSVEEEYDQKLDQTRDKYRTARSELDETRSRLDSAKSEVQKLRERLEDAKGENRDRLQKKIESKSNRLEELRRALDDKSSAVESMKERVADLKKERNQTQERLGKLESKLEKQRKRARQKAEKLKELKGAKERWSQKLERRESKYESAVSNLEQTRSELEQARQEIEKLRERRNEAQGEKREELADQLAEKTDRLGEMESKLERREGRVASLESEVEQLEEERQQARARLEKKRAEWKSRLRESQSKYESAKEELSEVKSRLERARSEIDRLETKKRQATGAEKKRLKEKLASRQKRLSSLEEKQKASSQRLEERKRQLEEARSELESTKSELDETKSELADYKSRLEERNQRIARLEERLDEAREAESGSAGEAGAARAKTDSGEANGESASAKSGDEANKQKIAELRRKLEKARRREVDSESKQLADGASGKTAEKRARGNSATEGKVGRAVPVRPPGESDGSGSEVSNSVEDIRLETDGDESRIVVELDRPSEYRRLPWKESRAVMMLNNVDLPDRLEQTVQADTESGAVQFVSSFEEEGGQVRMEAEVSPDADEQIRQEGDKLVWQFAPEAAPTDGGDRRAEAAESSQRPERPKAGDTVTAAPPDYPRTVTNPAKVDRVPGMSRKRLTIDLRNADIQNVLRLFSKEGGVNIVAGDEVSGSVTLRLQSVPLDEAFLIVLESLDLGFQVRGNVIRVAKKEKLVSEKQARQKRQRKEQQTRPLEVFLMPINYAEAGEMTGQVERLLSPRGSVSTDERTNTLIIKDLPENIRSIRKLVGELDTQIPQVLIEARIVETNDSFQQEVGIQWGGSFSAGQGAGNPTGLAFPNVIGIGGGATDGQTPTQGTSSNPNFGVNLPAPAGSGTGGALGMTLGSVNGAVNLNLRLSAAEEQGRAKIVSAPKVLTLDNSEATISQGTSIPISVVSAAGVQTVFVDATLELTVTPHVTPDGNVQMELSATKNEPDFQNTGSQGDPTILRKTAETSLLVEDGDTTVIGGIYTRNTGTNYTAVPVLHKIPILGSLFRTSSQTETRTELLIFITPRVVNRAESLGNMSAGDVAEAPGAGAGGSGGGGGGE